MIEMGKVTGFIEFKRDKQPYRLVEERTHDWKQVMLPWPVDASSGARKPPETPAMASARESCSTASAADENAMATSSANATSGGSSCQTRNAPKTTR